MGCQRHPAAPARPAAPTITPWPQRGSGHRRWTWEPALGLSLHKTLKNSSFHRVPYRDRQDFSRAPLKTPQNFISTFFQPLPQILFPSSLFSSPLPHTSAQTLPRLFANIPLRGCFPRKCRICVKKQPLKTFSFGEVHKKAARQQAMGLTLMWPGGQSHPSVEGRELRARHHPCASNSACEHLQSGRESQPREM